MLAQQQKLLADVRAAEQAARALVSHGVKILRVVQQLKAAGDELASRVRYLEAQSTKRKETKAPSAKS